MTDVPQGYWQVGGNDSERLVTCYHDVVRDVALSLRDLFDPERDRNRPISGGSRKCAHITEWIERATRDPSRHGPDHRVLLVRHGTTAIRPALSVVGELVIEHLGRLGILRPTRVWDRGDDFDPPYGGWYGNTPRVRERWHEDWSSLELCRVELVTWEAAAYLALDVDP